ncbi:MAG: hypothetical protein Ct9H300mP16_13650 [Pseudomonadota bacterium]|nr:MAG: hypothetical protein Ct9H300mP16_13650 [Pseudomonadota bacterium]
MTLLDEGALQPRNRTEYRQIGITLNRCAQLVFLAWTRHTVEYHTSDSDARVECAIAGQQRSDSTGYAGHVNDQHNRQVKLFRQRRITVTPFDIQSVVEAFVAFDE